jgi:hypothetical protein
MNERQEIIELERQLASKRQALASKEANCQHNWSDVKPAHIYHEGYTCPGDEPGTMGVDWRGPVYVPPRTEKRWERSCRNCGKVQYTSEATEQVTYSPKFS